MSTKTLPILRIRTDRSMNTTIGQIMSKEIVSVKPEESLGSAALLMKEHSVGSLPIVDEEKRLKGIMTDRDIVIRCVAKRKNPEAVSAGEIMTNRIVYVSAEQPVSEAVSMMATEQIRRLPVLEDGKIVGMISFADIARRDASPEVAEAISEISSEKLSDIEFVRPYEPHK